MCKYCDYTAHKKYLVSRHVKVSSKGKSKLGSIHRAEFEALSDVQTQRKYASAEPSRPLPLQGPSLAKYEGVESSRPLVLQGPFPAKYEGEEEFKLHDQRSYDNERFTKHKKPISTRFQPMALHWRAHGGWDKIWVTSPWTIQPKHPAKSNTEYTKISQS